LDGKLETGVESQPTKTARLSRLFSCRLGLSVSPVMVSVVMPHLASFFLDDRIVSAGLCEGGRRQQDRESNGKQQRDQLLHNGTTPSNIRKGAGTPRNAGVGLC
jgi:hypothetical protein